MLGTKSKTTAPAQPAARLSDRPLYAGGPSEAQLNDPESFWHLDGELERAAYVRFAGETDRLYKLKAHWDSPYCATDSYREDARLDAGLTNDSHARWPEPWPEAVSDPFGYYLHQNLRNAARSAAKIQRSDERRAARVAEMCRCACCGQVDNTTRAGRSASAGVKLCDPCMRAVALELSERSSVEQVDGKTRRALAAALLDAKAAD